MHTNLNTRPSSPPPNFANELKASRKLSISSDDNSVLDGVRTIRRVSKAMNAELPEEVLGQSPDHWKANFFEELANGSVEVRTSAATNRILIPSKQKIAGDVRLGLSVSFESRSPSPVELKLMAIKNHPATLKGKRSSEEEAKKINSLKQLEVSHANILDFEIDLQTGIWIRSVESIASARSLAKRPPCHSHWNFPRSLLLA